MDQQKRLELQRKAIRSLKQRILEEDCLTVSEARKRLGVSRATLEKQYPIEILPWWDATPNSKTTSRRYHPADVGAAPARLRAWTAAKARGEGEAYLHQLREELDERDRLAIELAQEMAAQVEPAA